MNRSESLKALLPALARARENFPTIARTRTGQIGKREIKYADLTVIMHLIEPVLAAEGLQIMHQIEGNTVGTTLFHTETAEFVSTTITIDTSDSPQAVGASITYMRRYGVSGLLALCTEEDTDADGVAEERRPAPATTSAATSSRRPSDPPEYRERSTQPTDPAGRVPASVRDTGDGWATKEDLRKARYWPAAFRAAEEAYVSITDANKFDASVWALQQCGISSQDHIPRNRLQEVVHQMAGFAAFKAGEANVKTDGIGDVEVPF